MRSPPFSLLPETLAARLRGTARAVVDLMLPPACSGCGAGIGDSGLGVCRACLSALRVHEAGPPSPRLYRRRMCAGLFWYEGEVREWVRRMKFGRDPALARPLGILLGEAVLAARDPRDPEARAVLAVPGDRKRTRARGFDPAAAIARGVADCVGIPTDFRILRRVGRSEPQSLLPPRKRRCNPRGAFRAELRRVAPGAAYLLVDDVYTTGATAAECLRVLRGAGAGASALAVAAVSPVWRDRGRGRPLPLRIPPSGSPAPPPVARPATTNRAPRPGSGA